ncbi:hypothetical protein [Brevibacterium metallidurans]|uniref:hypothetical protein n=1 Tax=Brevibacterium metallidurans TaxID=1482676 RepID=UPI0030DBC056
MSLELTHLLVFHCQPFEGVVAIRPGEVRPGGPAISGHASAIVSGPVTDFGSATGTESITGIGVDRLPPGFLRAFAFLVLLRHPGIPFGVDLSCALLQRFLHLEVVRRSKRIEPACRRRLGRVSW